MLGKIASLVKDNAGTLALGAAVGLGMFMFNDHKQADLQAPEKISKNEREKRKFKDLQDPNEELIEDSLEMEEEVGREPASESQSASYNPTLKTAESSSLSGGEVPIDTSSTYVDSTGSSAEVSYAESSESDSDFYDEENERPPLTDEEAEAGSYCMKYPYAAQCRKTGGSAGSGAVTEYFPTQVINSQCGNISVLPGTGIYVANPYVAITGTDVKQIFYCFNKVGDTECDPVALKQPYAGNFQVSTTPGFQDNGSFQLRFFAECYDGSKTSVVSADYKVDDGNVPLSYFQTPIIKRLQTQETHQTLTTTSTAFGTDPYSHFTYNLGNYDPSADTCQALAENLGFSIAGNGMRTIASVQVTSTAALTPTDYVTVPLSMYENPLMSYGDNFLVTFMQFTDGGGISKYGCLSNKVVLKDFTYMGIMTTGDYQTPSVNGVHQFQGQIQNFGHFGGVSPSGPGVGRLGNSQIETDLINIIN